MDYNTILGSFMGTVLTVLFLVAGMKAVIYRETVAPDNLSNFIHYGRNAQIAGGCWIIIGITILILISFNFW